MIGRQRLQVVRVGGGHHPSTDPDGRRDDDGINGGAPSRPCADLPGQSNESWGKRDDVGRTTRQAVDAGVGCVAPEDLDQDDQRDERSNSFALGESGDGSSPLLHHAAPARTTKCVDGGRVQD